MSSQTTTDSVRPAPRPLRRPTGFPWLKLLLAALGLMLVAMLLVVQDGVRLLFALSFAGIFFFLTVRAPAVGLSAVLVYLAGMGWLRRCLIPLYGWSGTDPLLLTGAIVILAILLLRRGASAPTRLSRLLLGLIALMVLETVNPFQGGLVVGLSGALIYVVPLLWYFAARRLATAHVMERVFPVVIGIAAVGALYGFYQTYFGFSEAERQWVSLVGDVYVALNVGNVIRPFSFFTSAAEYSHFLGFGVVLIWVFWLRGRRGAMLLMPLLVTALFLESVRTSIVSALVACVVLWAIQSRDPKTWPVRCVPALILAALGTIWGLQQVSVGGFSQGTQDLAAHSIAGLTDPNSSTAPSHLGYFANGIINGFRNPIGYGLGATTIAGRKFGGLSDGTEYDISNMFVSLGFVGGLLYLLIVVTILQMAFRFWNRERSMVGLGILGLLIFGFLQWLNSGEYGTSVLLWICVGALDRLLPERAPLSRSPAPRTARPNAPEAAR